MAIQKTHAFAGYSPDYWVVDNVVFIPAASTVKVQVSLYKDSTAYSAGESPIITQTELLEGGDFNFESPLSTYPEISLATLLSRAIYAFTEEKLITTGTLSGGTRV